MAAATITKTSYGYLVTGGNTATDVVVPVGSMIYVKRFIFIPATNADTVVIKDTKTGASIHKTAGAVAGTAYVDNVGGEKGTPYNGLNVTLSGASDELHIHIA